jgi:hypothetical protein
MGAKAQPVEKLTPVGFEVASWVQLDPSGGVPTRVAHIVPRSYERFARIGEAQRVDWGGACEVLLGHTTASTGIVGWWEGIGAEGLRGWPQPKWQPGTHDRNCLLAEVDLAEAASELMSEVLPLSRWGIGPNPTLLFPADRAWFIFEEVDGYFAHVGGAAATIESLLAAPRPPAVEVSPDDMLDLH